MTRGISTLKNVIRRALQRISPSTAHSNLKRLRQSGLGNTEYSWATTDNLLRLSLNWDGLGGSCLYIREKDHHSTLLPWQGLKSLHLRCYEGVIAPVAWVTCTSVTAPLTPRGNYRPWNNTWCQHGDHILFRNVPTLKDHAEQNSAPSSEY